MSGESVNRVKADGRLWSQTQVTPLGVKRALLGIEPRPLAIEAPKASIVPLDYKATETWEGK